MAKTATKAKVRPLGDNILVKRTEADEKTAGGIVLPDSAKEKPKEGLVIALGDGRMLDDGKRGEFSVRANDRVLFSSYAGTEIKVSGEDYLLISENDVLAVIE